MAETVADVNANVNDANALRDRREAVKGLQLCPTLCIVKP